MCEKVIDIEQLISHSKYLFKNLVNICINADIEKKELSRV